LGSKPAGAPVVQPDQELRRRRGSGARPAVRGHAPGAPEAAVYEGDSASSEAAAVVLPEAPDPLLLPVAAASATGWSLLSEIGQPALRAKGVERGARSLAADPVKPPRRPAKLMAYAAPAPVMSAPAPVLAAPRETPAPARLASEPVRPFRSSASTVAGSAPTAAVPIVSAARVALSAPATPAAAAAKPVAVAAPMTRTVLGDQAMFGQAMRKLRMENNPALALKVLQEHAQEYPRSSLGGERNALEVEALLALHRDRDALARLDTMALDDLPRSGERFVVRGELRAAARRWQEASADFDQALARVTGSPGLYERALWGRGAARLRCGEREAGLADLERYLDKYPSGRFAGQAAKFFPNR
jgi:hypothetical protein